MNRNFRDKELHKVALNGYVNTSSDIDKSMFYVLIILFVLMQKHFVEGIAGAVKS